MNPILNTILGHEDIYAGITLADYKEDVTGWGGRHPIFDDMIQRLRPRVIIEVGTWKGESALHMAKACRDNGIAASIICVDTWLGSAEHWLTWPHELRLKNGGPTLYHQFLANVLFRDAQSMIVPFQTTSGTAAEVLTAKGIKADLIYIDADHRETAVFNDMQSYYPLLLPGGVLFGHDYQFESVRNAINRFCEIHQVMHSVVDEFWMIKPQ